MNRFSLSRSRPVCLAFVLLLAPGGGAASAVDGLLDASFDGDGILEIAWDYGGSLYDTVRDVASDEEGNIYLVGALSSETVDFDWALARRAADGTLLKVRNYFDAGGANHDVAEAVTTDTGLLGDTFLLVAGTVDGPSAREIRLCRYSATNLQLDTQFGSNGCASLALGSSNLSVSGVARGGFNAIRVGGTIESSGDADFFVVQFTNAGVLDTTFGNSVPGVSLVTWDFVPSGYDTLASMTIDRQGRTVLAGVADGGGISYAAVARLDAGGDLDSSFGSNGTGKTWLVVMYNQTFVETGAMSLARLPTGDAFDVGWRYRTGLGSWESLVSRIDASGSNWQFLGNLTWNAATDNPPRRLVRQCDGKLVAVGESDEGVAFQTRRLLLDGGTDASFGSSGVFGVEPDAEGYGFGTGVAAAALDGGRLVIAGDVWGTNGDWIVVRLTSDLLFCDGFEIGGTGNW